MSRHCGCTLSACIYSILSTHVAPSSGHRSLTHCCDRIQHSSFQCLGLVPKVNMPSCCAYGCTNNQGQGKGLFRFPSAQTDRVRREAWILAVSRKGWSPSISSVVCSDHFTEDSFVHPPSLIQDFGLKRNLRLQPNAVPSVFKHKEPPLPTESAKARKCRRVSSSDLHNDAYYCSRHDHYYTAMY